MFGGTGARGKRRDWMRGYNVCVRGWRSHHFRQFCVLGRFSFWQYFCSDSMRIHTEMWYLERPKWWWMCGLALLMSNILAACVIRDTSCESQSSVDCERVSLNARCWKTDRYFQSITAMSNPESQQSHPLQWRLWVDIILTFYERETKVLWLNHNSHVATAA